MMIKQLLILVTCISTLAGCGVSDSSEIERTYPEAFNYETVSIQQLLNEVETPDSLNIETFIFNIIECPEEAICVYPDGIMTSENLPPSDTLFIQTMEPRQFKIDNQYKISLSVDKRETREYPDLRILGYSEIK